MRENEQGGSESVIGKESKTLEELEDSSTKRLGRGHLEVPPSGRSESTQRSRRKALDPSIHGGRGPPVPQVSEIGCGCKTWTRNGLGVQVSPASSPDPHKQPHASASSKSSSPFTPGSLNSPSSNRKLSKSVSGYFFRRSKAAEPVSPSPKFEEEWSSFREQHQQEMEEMKRMYSALQSMCQEMKTITLQPAPQRESSPSAAACDGGGKSPSKTHPQKAKFASEKKGPCEKEIPPRRAGSTPRTRRTLGSVGPARDMGKPITLSFKIAAWSDSTTALFEEIVQVQKAFLRSFCASLVKHGEARASTEDVDGTNVADVVGALTGRLLPHTSFAKPWHLKYGVEAWVNKIVLREFGSESYCLLGNAEAPLDSDRADQMSSSWDEYQKLALLSPTDAIDPEGKDYHRNFHVFCNRKFQAIHDELQWWDEWPQALVEDFLEAMKHVWRAHKLAFSFDPPAAIFCVKKSTTFDSQFMESLDVLTASPLDSSLFSTKVGFMVTPGFLVQDRVIRSQVYLLPSAGLTFSPSK